MQNQTLFCVNYSLLAFGLKLVHTVTFQYVLQLFNGKVKIYQYADFLWPHFSLRQKSGQKKPYTGIFYAQTVKKSIKKIL